ncbi:MAG TPA: SurA N-terminal domain-containing protein [Candidatus Angelobacter sp.]|nr:SurA N-terminal domain-containing protein [Candidatus Angelobacter sp.]
MIQSPGYWRALSCLALLGIFAAVSGCTGCGTGSSNPDVMAKVNGYKVLRSEVDKSYNMQIAGSPQKPTPAQEEALRLNILDQIIGMQLHLQQAEKLGVVATDDEVESKFNQMKALYTQEEFDKKLKDQGLTQADAKQEIRRNITIEKLLNKEIASKVTISDADIQDYYTQHRAEFNLIEPRYFLASILVYVRPPGQPAGDKGQTDAQARQKIQMIYNRLESGEDFGTVASQWSEDADTAHNGGEMGAVPESQLKNTDPATREAVEKLKPGQYSNIIPMVSPESRQPIGYRIVKLITKEAAGQRDLNDPAVQSFIRTQLRNQREQLLRTAYNEVLRDKAEIHNYYAESIMKSTGTTK